MKNYSKTILLICFVSFFQPITAVTKKKFTGKKLEEISSVKERAEAFKEFSAGLQEPTEDMYVPRGLIIFLDDSENDVGAMSEGLFTALSQQAGPIIVSTSLLKNVFSEYGTKDTDESAQDLRMRFNRRNSLKTTDGKPDIAAGIKVQKYVLIKATRFDPAEWIIKDINDSLYLLIPRAYLSAHNITVDVSAAKITDPENITSFELQLGLKVDHMETKTIEDVVKQPAQKHDYATYFIPALVQEIVVDAAQKKTKQRSDIFCTRADYFAQSFTTMPLWSIYQGGHGKMEQNVNSGAITSLSLDDFKTELDFFEHALNLELFVYSTCYGAGVNTEIVYQQAQKNSESALQRPLSFPVITHAITDAPTSTLKIGIKVGTDGGLILDASEHFDLFLQATEQQITNYGEVIKHLFLVVPEYRGIQPQIWGNVPQIKLPGIEWFAVIASQEYIVSIGSTFAKTRDPEQPLDFTKFFRTVDPKTKKPKPLDLRAILLYTNDVPFELIIDLPNMDAIISMIPGDATHKLKKISSSKHSVNAIVKWFMNIDLLAPEKIFFIEEIHGVDGGLTQDIKDVIVYNKTTPGTKGLNPTEERRECDAFYTDSNGKSFIRAFNKKVGDYKYLGDPEDLTDPGKISIYKDLLAKMQGKINSLGILNVLVPPKDASYLIDTTTSTRVSKLNASCTIEKIEDKSGPVDMFEIFLALRYAISPGVIVWVKEMTGNYDKSEMNLPDKKFGDVITITDVIYGRGNEFPLFTYDGKFYQKSQEVSDYRKEYKERMASPSSTKQRKSSLLPSKITPEGIEAIKKVLKNPVTVLTKNLEALKRKLTRLSEELEQSEKL